MKKFLLFLMFALFCIPWAANAQTTVTIGDLETATNDTYLPMNSLYEYSYTQQIYTADEIGTAGTINAITIWMYGAADLYTMPFDIYMVETEKESFTGADWESVSSSDIVYSGSVTVHNTEAEAYTFELDVPFVYSGTGNLLIAFDNNCGQWKGGLNGKVFTATDNVSRSNYVRRDSEDYDPTNMGSITGTARAMRNVIEIDITPGGGPSCARPNGLAINYTGGTTAEVSWNSDATAWNIDVNGTVTAITTNPYTLTGLTLGTAYTVKVQANCGGGDLSDWSSAKSFTTDLCMPENMCELSYELTDSYGDGWNGNAIKVVDAATGAEIANLTIASGSSASGTISVCDGRAINFVWVTGSYASETSYTFYDINNEEIFNGSAGSGVITDYVVNCTPAACLKPQNLTYSVSGNEITLNWTSDATLWNVEVNGVAISTSSNPYTFTGELATEYTVRVQADCGHNDVSEWTNAVSFTTDACMPEEQIIVNYTLNDSYGDGWNGNAILVVDENCNLVEQLTIESGASASGTVKVCGSYVQFLWYAGNYPTETSWSFTDNAGNVLFEGAGTSDMANLDVLYTIDNNPYSAPTDVAVSEVGPHSAKLSWTETGTATTWQIKLTAGDDEEGTIIDANSNPFVLTGLDPETEYYAQVRATGADGTSLWTCLGADFTTDVACPAPTELVVNPLVTSAEISWNGFAETYDLEWAPKPTSTVEGSWLQYDNGTMQANVGSSTAGVWTWGVKYPSTMLNSNNTLSKIAFYEVDNSYYTDGTVTVKIYSGGDAVPATLLYTETIATEGTNGMREVTLSSPVQIDASSNLWITLTANATYCLTMSNQDGGVDSRWFNNSGNWVDFGTLYTAGAAYSFMIRGYIESIDWDAVVWTTESNVTSPTTLNDLSAESEYLVRVKANCGGEDGESIWSQTPFTTASACDAPNILPAEVDGTTATLSWEGYQESFNLNYRKQVVDPTAPATIIITVPDVWGDGSGYQMLLDADANTYGTIIPETGGLTESGDASEETYAEFEYKIPTNADGSLTTENILINQTVTIEIPAGTYDWCITNPTPEDRVWIASSQGNVSGRQDDFVFEPGVTYEFTVGIHGTNDGVDLTVTRPMGDWVVVENVTSPYELAELDPATYYEWQVEGINANCTGDLTSEIANFTTGIRCGIVLNEPDYMWEETFESYTVEHTDGGFTNYLPGCWTLVKEYTGASPDLNNIGLGVDTLPQVFYYPSFDANHDGNQTLRMKFHSLVAMPELDESVDMSRLHLSMWVRQPQTYYHLQVGVLTDLADDSTFEPLADIDNESTDMEHIELDFSRYQGNGRYIAFKNLGGSSSNPYCTQYLDDIVLTYNAAPAECGISELYYKEGFEGYTINPGATGVEPDCWEVIDEISALDFSTKPQLYAGFNTTEGGNYTLRMLNRCVYAMPELSSDIDVNTLTMTFSLRQPKAVYRLQVGVLDADNNFELVEEIDNEITDMVEDVMVNFADYTGNGHRIAFRNVLNGRHYKYSYNYLDDIYIDLTENFDVDPSKSINDLTDGAEEYLNRIAVYPNPTTGMLHIDAVDVQKVECYSQMGQLVGVYDNVNELNISELANGVYTLRITVPQGVTMRKVVKR